ncbi:MAG: hypothetical protein ACYTGX_16335 [Planctomycetota bacterium]|jgi:tetratricopeptide (TPR) repeat protein
MPEDLTPLWDKLEATDDPAEQLAITREALAKTTLEDRGEYVGWRLELMRLLDQEDADQADQAVATLQELIAASPRETHENDWIRLHRHLGTALLHHPNADAADPQGAGAKGAFESALSAFTAESNPRWWGLTHWRLSLVYWERRPAGDNSDIQKAAEHLEEAIRTLPPEEEADLLTELKSDLLTIRAALAE